MINARKAMSKDFNQFEYQNKYNSEKYDRLNIMVPKGRREILKIRAKSMGMSLNKYVISAIEQFDPEVNRD